MEKSVYQTMQLGTADIKNMIKNAQEKSEKRKIFATLVLKNVLCIAFCMAFVVTFATLFGAENSIVGVVSLIAILMLRQTNFDIKGSQGVIVVVAMFAVFAVAPHWANLLPPFGAFLVNLVSITLILVLSCHNPVMFNHTTFLLGYLLLMGYDVSGQAYTDRVLGLITGCVLVALVYYVKHRKDGFQSDFGDLFKDFFVLSPRTMWQIKMGVGVSLGLLLGQLLHVPRIMWIGFACMSFLAPGLKQHDVRMTDRMLGLCAGSALFGFLYLVMPADLLTYIGLIGGVAVGFAASYRWQTAFNCLGALAMAAGTLGLGTAIVFRIANNLFGILYSFIFYKLYKKCETYLHYKKKLCLSTENGPLSY